MPRKKDPERITSTHVENTELAEVLKVNAEDHLHTRGEY